MVRNCHTCCKLTLSPGEPAPKQQYDIPGNLLGCFPVHDPFSLSVGRRNNKKNHRDENGHCTIVNK